MDFIHYDHIMVISTQLKPSGHYIPFTRQCQSSLYGSYCAVNIFAISVLIDDDAWTFAFNKAILIARALADP